MAVLTSALIFYGSANMPDVDGTITGGALNAATIINFNDITPNGTMDYVSRSTLDTGVVITLTGRDATGAIKTEAKTLTGTTMVLGSQIFERLMKGIVSGSIANGDVAALSHIAVISGTAQGATADTANTAATITLASTHGSQVALDMILRITNDLPSGVFSQLRRIIGISGDVITVSRGWGIVPTNTSTYSIYHGMMFDFLPTQVTQNRRLFYNASADVAGGSNRTFYEKIFCVNTNTSTSLTIAQISKQIDTGNLQFALTNALNDTSTIANRQTTPTVGITAFTAGSPPQTINVPSPQALPFGAAPNAAGAQGIWLSNSLIAGTPPKKNLFTLRAAGTT